MYFPLKSLLIATSMVAACKSASATRLRSNTNEGNSNQHINHPRHLQETADLTLAPSEYKKFTNYACRTKFGGAGQAHKDFELLHISRDDCREECTLDFGCYGWEYSKGRCELWNKGTPIKKIDLKHGFDCYLKK